MIDKILVAVRTQNETIFDTALSLAQTTGATLMLLHVINKTEASYPILPTYTYYPVVDDREYDLYQQQLAKYQQWGLDLLQNLTEEATAAGVNTEYTQLTGNPGKMICELASNWSADLILVGSRGLRGLQEMFLGSVSNYVTHHAPCSVLIVRKPLSSDSDLEIAGEEAVEGRQQFTLATHEGNERTNTN